MLSIIGIGLRVFLLFIAAVVLALSVTLAREQAIGQVPPETGFGTFVGAAGFFASVFGMAALWFDQINGKILISLDTLVSVFYLAGAISLTIAMKNVPSCTATDGTSQYYRGINKIISGGCVHSSEGPLCPHVISADGKDLTQGRCQMAQADYVFEYAGFILGLVMVFMGYILHRRGRGGAPPTNRPYI
ncbi:hypothetical protein GGS24DRAFT_494850 [Hypoxylon argillaceum]|nr:hypothetical protein GGS24DRAFT_494850 [Hypoxylon argillaceum]